MSSSVWYGSSQKTLRVMASGASGPGVPRHVARPALVDPRLDLGDGLGGHAAEAALRGDVLGDRLAAAAFASEALRPVRRKTPSSTS